MVHSEEEQFDNQNQDEKHFSQVDIPLLIKQEQGTKKEKEIFEEEEEEEEEENSSSSGIESSSTTESSSTSNDDFYLTRELEKILSKRESGKSKKKSSSYSLKPNNRGFTLEFSKEELKNESEKQKKSKNVTQKLGSLTLSKQIISPSTESSSSNSQSREKENTSKSSSSSEEESVKKVDYLVKFKGISYLHLRWVPESYILGSTMGKQRLDRFNKRVWPNMTMKNKKKPFNTDFLVVERILDWDDPEYGTLNEYKKMFELELKNKKRKKAMKKNRRKKKVKKRNYNFQTSFFVKWKGLPYTESTWEFEKYITNDNKITEFLNRCLGFEKRFECFQTLKSIESTEYTPWKSLKESPKYKNGNKLRDYQVEGLNWLTFNWHQGRNGILADQMGLGKSIQTIAFLHYLRDQQKIHGPFLLVVPLSTLYNWQKEFESWSDLNYVVYHGNKTELETIRNYEWFHLKQEIPNYSQLKSKSKNQKKNKKNKDKKKEKEKIKAQLDTSSPFYNFYKFDVIITTYEIALRDRKYFWNIEWELLVVDEAHRLKNNQSKLYQQMFDLDAKATLFLTGTPLQNSLKELWNLLHFLEPFKFENENDFLFDFGDMKDSSQVEKLHKILKPHLLRRLKEDVEKSIIPKEETIIEVELTKFQKQWYKAILQKNLDFLTQGLENKRALRLVNVVMQLRKVCNHPYLIQGAEEYFCKEKEAKNENDVMNALVTGSGKFVLLDKLIPKLKNQGSKILIFSQMVRVLDIIEDYVTWKGYKFERIDGSVRGDLRQQSIDRFNNPKKKVFIFLLCTRAGGVGINLTSANTVIIFDSDWNPQNDIQAMDRCHRIGQTKLVNVYRLITRNTYEREMFDRASKKLGLDQAVLTNITGSKTNLNSGSNADLEDSLNNFIYGKNKSKKLNSKEINELLKYGSYNLFKESEDQIETFHKENIDQILKNRTTKVIHDPLNNKNNGNDNNNSKSSTFSRATFVSEEVDTSIDINDPEFWKKLMPEKFLKHKKLEELKKNKLNSTGFRRVTRRYKKKLLRTKTYRKKKRGKYYKENDNSSNSSSEPESSSESDSETHKQLNKLIKYKKIYKGSKWVKGESRKLFYKGLLKYGYTNERWNLIKEKNKLKKYSEKSLSKISTNIMKLLFSTIPSRKLLRKYPLLVTYLYNSLKKELRKTERGHLDLPVRPELSKEFHQAKEKVSKNLQSTIKQAVKIRDKKLKLKKKEKLEKRKKREKEREMDPDLKYFLRDQERKKKLELEKDPEYIEQQKQMKIKRQLEKKHYQEKIVLIRNIKTDIKNNSIFSIDKKMHLDFFYSPDSITNLNQLLLLNLKKNDLLTISKYINSESVGSYNTICEHPALLDYQFLQQIDENFVEHLSILELLATLNRLFTVFFAQCNLKSYISDSSDLSDSDPDPDPKDSINLINSQNTNNNQQESEDIFDDKIPANDNDKKKLENENKIEIKKENDLKHSNDNEIMKKKGN